MEMSNAKAVDTKRIKCPECLNYMCVDIKENGSAMGCCPRCHATIIVRRRSDKERLIRIVKK